MLQERHIIRLSSCFSAYFGFCPTGQQVSESVAMFSWGSFSGLTFLKAICLPTDLSNLTNLGVFTGAEINVCVFPIWQLLTARDSLLVELNYRLAYATWFSGINLMRILGFWHQFFYSLNFKQVGEAFSRDFRLLLAKRLEITLVKTRPVCM